MTRIHATLVAVALCASACGGGDAGASVAGLDGEWVLSGSEPAIDAPAEGRIDLTIATDGTDTVVRGQAACNSYDGSVAIGGDGSWRSAGYARTEMGCDEPLMTAEQAYLDVLGTVDSWSLVDAEHLLLQGPAGSLTFDAVAPAEPAAFEDTIWQLDGIVGKDEGEATGVSSTSADAPPFHVQFLDGGALLADDGCQSYAGDWSRDGDTVRTSVLQPGADDREPCTDAAAAAAADQLPRVLPLLEDAELAIAIDGDRLQLSNVEGGLTLRSTGETNAGG